MSLGDRSAPLGLSREQLGDTIVHAGIVALVVIAATVLGAMRIVGVELLTGVYGAAIGFAAGRSGVDKPSPPQRPTSL